MANTPIVSDSNNSSYNQLLSTTNGFYRAEAWNLGVASGTTLAVSTPRYINTTFANAGNCQGIVLGLSAGSILTTAYGVEVRLEQYATVTTPVASPGIVTWTGHGLSGGEEISFTTTGTLPTGIVSGTRYFVKYINANTFNISATSGGSNINFTGSSSGTHSCGVRRAYKELTAAQINPEYILGSAMGTSGNNYVGMLVPFKFTTPYAVDGTASKWRFRIADGVTAGATSTWYVITSDATNLSYVTWCDTKVTSADNDILIVVDKVIINKSFTTGSATGTGETTQGVAGWICRSTDISASNVCLLEWDGAPASSYTFTFGGNIYLGSFSGFRVGQAGFPIPNAQQAKITRVQTTTAGSANTCGFKDLMNLVTAKIKAKTALFLYGEIPTKPYGILASDAAISQANIITTEDLSANWAVNDYLFVGKQNVKGQGTVAWQQISSISGTTITLSSNLLTNTRKSGGTVVNRDRGYGIHIYGYSTTSTMVWWVEHPMHLQISGCKINAQIIFCGSFNYSYDYPVLPANRTKFIIEDNLIYGTGEAFYACFANIQIPPEGISIKRNISFWLKLFTSYFALYKKTIPTIPFYSGLIEFKNNRYLATTYTSTGGGSTNIKIEIEDNYFENNIVTGGSFLTVSGNYVTLKRNYFWGSAMTGTLGGAVVLSTCNNADIQDNHYDNNTCALSILPTAFILGAVAKNEIFGAVTANTYDFVMLAAGFYDIEFINPTGALNFDTASISSDAIVTSRFRITTKNGVTNDDGVLAPYGNWQRCGTSLTDTTVHTSGSGKFSLRFEPTFTEPLSWIQKIPTGDILGLTMSVSVWVKINSATYYAGTHQKPRLNINYDNGTIVYSEATATTAWQLLTVSFAPTTTYGQITVYINGYTDATTTNAYFYVDDLSVFFPPGIQLNLGGLDLWANGLPIIPSIATNVSALDVWNVPIANILTTGSIGEKAKKDLTISQFIALK